MSYCIDARELLGCVQGDQTEKWPPQGWEAHQLKDGHMLLILLIDIFLMEVFDLILHVIVTSKLLQAWMARKNLKE